MTKYGAKHGENKFDGSQISHSNASTAPNENLRVNKQYILKEPEIRAMHIIKAKGAIDQKMWNRLWVKGIVATKSCTVLPELTEYGEQRLQWIRNDMTALPDDVRFPNDPKA